MERPCSTVKRQMEITVKKKSRQEDAPIKFAKDTENIKWISQPYLNIGVYILIFYKDFRYEDS